MRVILALKQGTKTLNILSKNNSNRISNSIIVNISIKNLMLSDTEKIMKLFKKHNSTIENKFHDERKNIKFLKFINNISNNNIKKNTK